MEDIGSLVFYILIGLIAIIGSLQGKGKKRAGIPKPGQKSAGGSSPAPHGSGGAHPHTSPGKQYAGHHPGVPSPGHLIPDPFEEGRFEKPFTGYFVNEGSEDHSKAMAFRGEGSTDMSVAAQFAHEGVSSFDGYALTGSDANDISEGEITDAPLFDYNSDLTAQKLADEFDIRKAIVYSAILNREEYSY